MITLFTGPMFSSKSTQLYYAMEKAVYAGKNIALIRPERDNRPYIAHSIIDKGFEEFINSKKVKQFIIHKFDPEIIETLKEFSDIFVDEFFMIKGCKNLCEGILPEQNLFFAGLISTSENTLFDEAKELIPLCDHIHKYNGVCVSCGSYLGNYSMFKSNKTISIVIGDSDKYECVCRECYIANKGHL